MMMQNCFVSLKKTNKKITTFIFISKLQVTKAYMHFNQNTKMYTLFKRISMKIETGQS